MFQRIKNLIRGFFGLFIGGIEKSNPEALLEVEKENLREQIGKYNKGLASHAALCERLMTQIKRQEGEEAKLRAKIQAHLKAGNKGPAAEYALRYQEVQRDLADNRSQLDEAEKTYKDLTVARDVSIRQARAKIESLKQSISDMKIKQATAELNEMAAGMISEIGGAGDTLNRLEEMVEEERSKAAGRARVARDGLDIGSVELQEVEHDALANQALADFAAAEGIAFEADAAAAADTPVAESDAGGESGNKSMGPVAGTE